MATRLLIDGNGVATRCWWASPHGVSERFIAAIERAKPTSGADVTVCWDGAGSWRREIFPAYKANRGPKPQALIASLEECKRAFPGYVAHGYEADDLLATFARQPYLEWDVLKTAHASSGVTLILSDDKDLLQLVAPKIIVIGSNTAIYDHRISVEKKLGVGPENIRHLLSWMGDKTDGLPGVPGYGKKKAIAKALAGEIGNQMTFELAALATVPAELMERV